MYGETDYLGNITINRKLRGNKKLLRETLRHEMLHSSLSPKHGPLKSLRGRIGQFGYDNSHLLRYTEEALAEGIARRSLVKGLRFPLQNYDIGLNREN